MAILTVTISLIFMFKLLYFYMDCLKSKCVFSKKQKTTGKRTSPKPQ